MSTVEVPPLGSAPARLLRLLSARLPAPGSSALPGRGPATGRPATASEARANRLQSRSLSLEFTVLGPPRRAAEGVFIDALLPLANQPLLPLHYRDLFLQVRAALQPCSPAALQPCSPAALQLCSPARPSLQPRAPQPAAPCDRCDPARTPRDAACSLQPHVVQPATPCSTTATSS